MANYDRNPRPNQHGRSAERGGERPHGRSSKASTAPYVVLLCLVSAVVAVVLILFLARASGQREVASRAHEPAEAPTRDSKLATAPKRISIPNGGRSPTAASTTKPAENNKSHAPSTTTGTIAPPLSAPSIAPPAEPPKSQKPSAQPIAKAPGLKTKPTAGRVGSPAAIAIGSVAPEIAGQDIDGVRFKLSDYRGKVVVIDFWGDW